MSGAIQAVVGIVEIAVGAVLDYFSFGTLGNSLILAGAGQLLGFAVSLLTNPRRGPLIPIGASYSGTLEPRRIIFGQLKVSGMYTVPPMTRGPNNDYLEIVLTVAGHPVTAFSDIYFNQTRIASADIGPVTGTINDGAVGATITDNGYQNLAWIRRYTGTQTAADYVLLTNFTAWDSHHIGFNLAYWAISLKYDLQVFAYGIPQVSGICQGAALYDPRLDSTNGGSGPQRYGQPSTWTYSTNPALALRWFLTAQLGLSEQQTRIDDVLCAAAANICDEQVTVPAPVVPGLVNWQNGSQAVAGVGTAFLRDLNKGQFQEEFGNFYPTPYPATTLYLYGPDGAWHQVAWVNSDILLTLQTPFPGTSAYDQVSQWNTAQALTVTQPRYTCNTVLDASGRYEDNIAQLARAMMGQCLYSGGMWRMYAGAWTGPAFELAEADLVGGISIQCSTPRQNLYNAVRGNFINPARNYVPDEFPPIINTAFATEDGEEIFTETNFPCCTDIYEAQRNAIIVSRVSRDQQVVTAQYGMSAYGVKVWETGPVTIAEIGWIQQSVRCIGWKFTPKGSIELQLQEAYSADWTDPVPTDYVLTGANTVAQTEYVPYPPIGLTTSSVPGGIMINVTLPPQVIPGTKIKLFEGTAATPFSAALLVATSDTTLFALPKTDTVTRYYWAETLGGNNSLSAPYPSGNGVAGAAFDASNEFIPAGNCFADGSIAIKVGGVDAWDSSVYTVQAHPTCHIAGKPTTVGVFYAMLGFSTAPAASPSYLNMAYGWYNGAGNWYIYESGTEIGEYGAIAVTDQVAVTYNQATGVLTYIKNNVVIRTVAIANQLFYGFCPFYGPGTAWNSLGYGPTTSLEVIDTPQISQNAASTIASTASAAPVYCESNVSHSNSVDIINLIVTTTGSPIEVDSGCTAVIGTTSGVVMPTCNLSIYRDGAQIASMIWDPTFGGSSSVNSATNPGAIPVTLVITDAPAAGSHTYTMHANVTVEGPSGNGSLGCSNNFLKVREIKR